LPNPRQPEDLNDGKKPKGPDFARGVLLTKFTDGDMLQGHFKGEPILVARRADAYFAIGATCTHYSGPLADEQERPIQS